MSTSAPLPDDIRSDIYTLFTKANGTKLILSLPYWCKITFRLESAGPVAIGTREDLQPVNSGKGRLLPANSDVVVVVPPNNRLYIASTSMNRVSVQVESFPYLSSILAQITHLVNKMGGSPPPRAKDIPGFGKKIC